MIYNHVRIVIVTGLSALLWVACAPEERAAEMNQRADERIDGPSPTATPATPPPADSSVDSSAQSSSVGSSSPGVALDRTSGTGSSSTESPSAAAAEGPEGVVLTRSVAAGEVDLGIYVGHLPFHPVDDVSFMEHPLVDLAVREAVMDDDVREMILTSEGPQPPVFVYNETGVSNLDEDLGEEARVAAWGCREQACDTHNWTIVLYRDGSEPEVCYHLEGQTQWLRAGQPPEATDNACPTDS